MVSLTAAACGRMWPPVAARGRSWPPLAARGRARPWLPVAVRGSPWSAVAIRGRSRPWPLVAASGRPLAKCTSGINGLVERRCEILLTFGPLFSGKNNRAISGQNSRRIFGQNNRGNKRRKTPITNIKNVSKNVIFQTRYMAKV